MSVCVVKRDRWQEIRCDDDDKGKRMMQAKKLKLLEKINRASCNSSAL